MTTNLPGADNNVGFNFVATHTAGSASAQLVWLDWAGLEFSGRALVR